MTKVHQRRSKRHAFSQSQPTFFDWLNGPNLRDTRIDQRFNPMFSNYSGGENCLDMCVARFAKRHQLPLRVAALVVELASIGPREVP
jgi:hypothetical protein